MMWQPILIGIARHLLTLVSGWMVARGYLDADAASQVAGAVVGIVGVALSAHDKARPVIAPVPQVQAVVPTPEAVVIAEPTFPDKKYPL